MRPASGVLALALLLALASPRVTSSGANAENGPFVPLREAVNPELQRALEETVTELGLDEAVRRKRLGVALAGITDPECPRLASINGNRMMYAASLPKIAILLAAFRKIEEGELALDEDTEWLLTEMIRRSSNSAATEMIRRVGRDYIASVLQSDEYRLYDPGYGGGLWVGKEYSKRRAFRRDPLRNLSHGASPIQVARFFYLLESGRLASPELTEKMKEMLADPAIAHKFVAGIGAVHPEARIFRKSGTWREYHSDGALIEHDGKRYIAVAMAQSAEGEAWLRRLIVALDRLIFRVPATCPGGEAAR